MAEKAGIDRDVQSSSSCMQKVVVDAGDVQIILKTKEWLSITDKYLKKIFVWVLMKLGRSYFATKEKYLSDPFIFAFFKFSKLVFLQ